jgi:YidC/Oxa1 family membrane protein insertase
MFDLLFEGFSGLLAFFYSVIPSYGVAIILLTVAVRLLLFPLTAKQAKSMYAMQRIQPEMKRLQAKYKNDRQKLNEEMMKFYKENNVNPLAGCLPLLLQMPLFIVLYQVLQGLTRTVIIGAVVVGGSGAGPTLEAGRLAYEGGRVSAGTVEQGVLTKGTLSDVTVLVDGEEVGVVESAKIVNGTVDSAPVVDAKGLKVGDIRNLKVEGGRVRGDPKYISKDTDLYQDLSKDAGKMEFATIDLARSAGDEHDGFGETLPYFVLVALVVATGYYQQRQMTARNPQAAQNPQAQMMGKIFPALFGVISLNIAAGVVLYFVVSNLWQIGQQAVIFRSLGAVPVVGGGGSDIIEAKVKPKDEPDDGGSPAKQRPTKGRPTPPRDRPSGNGRTTEPGTRQRQRRKKGR